jgi:hypothetical protein
MPADSAKKKRRKERERCCNRWAFAGGVVQFILVFIVAASVIAFGVHLWDVYGKAYQKNLVIKEYGVEMSKRVCTNVTLIPGSPLFGDCQEWTDNANMDVGVAARNDVGADIKSHLDPSGYCSDGKCSWFLSKFIDALLSSLAWFYISTCAVIIVLAWKCGPVRAARRIAHTKVVQALDDDMEKAIPTAFNGTARTLGGDDGVATSDDNGHVSRKSK